VGGTSRGRRSLATNALAAFGLVSAGLQFVGQLIPTVLPSAAATIPGSVMACVIWGMLRASPRRRLSHEFRNPRMTVSVAVGDLFDQDADIVVGFTDTFDTSTAGDLVINSSSVQGQLVARHYSGDHRLLDKDLNVSLSQVTPVARETRRSKPLGKLLRYPLGTVAVISKANQRIFAVAYSRMEGNVARSSVQDLWLGLDRLWEAVYLHGQRRRLAIPIVGSRLARVDALSREGLLRMILLSFIARSRQAVICDELLIMIHPRDLDEIDLLEVSAFLRAIQ
jgi:hypothetical protein